MNKLISSGENKVSYVQIFGFILIVTGVLAIIIVSVIDEAKLTFIWKANKFREQISN